MAEVCVNGETLALDPSGALWWPSGRALVVADLHFEKGSAYARKGALLPPYDTRTTLRRLAAAIARREPRLVVALGDSFHDGGGPERLGAAEREELARAVGRAEWLWIAGNHDPDLPSWLGGTVAGEAAVGGLVFRHEPKPAPATGEVAGHLHPCARVGVRGRSLRRRCFVSDDTRIVLPAFGAYAGGLEISDPAIAGLFPRGYDAHLLGRDRVYAAARGRPRAHTR